MDKNELRQSNVGAVAEKTPIERKHAKASQNFKEAIKNYLDKRAQEDALFRTKYETTTRTIDEVVTYILNEVKASGCCGFQMMKSTLWLSTSLTSRPLKSVSLSNAMW